MPLSHDLLAQAQILVTLDLTKPKQANLGRAVSAAYYALFHLLVAACIRRVGPSSPATLAPRIARSLAHSEMRDVCLPISKSNPANIIKSLLPVGFSAEIERFAQAFVDLQQERHRADYDPNAIFTRTEAIELLARTQAAFDDWKRVQNTDEANVFLSPDLRKAVGQMTHLLLNLQRRTLLRLQSLRPSKLPPHLLTGIRGEFEALFFLRRLGFTIVDRRWRSPEHNGDLDLIAWEADTLCFIEVKTRSARDMTPAALAVDPAKRRMLEKMAASYRRSLPQQYRKDVVSRFDIVSVYLLDERVECELVRDVI